MATYQLISSVTVGSGGAAAIDFTSIPATYTDLVLKLTSRSTDSSSGIVNISFNSNTTGYTNKYLQGNGSSASSASNVVRFAAAFTGSTDTANTFANCEIYIPNYAGSNNKSYSADNVTETNGTQAYIFPVAGLWSNTSAITSISLTCNSGNFVQYSTAYLYGISNA